MATGTYAPDVDLRVVDSNGVPISGGLVWTYIAGTSTPVATYTDVALATSNSNPIVAGSDGRFVAFLTPGVSYKFVYESAATPPTHGTVLITRDNISAIPTSAANVDVTGTAGEDLPAGTPVYLSDGSGSKTAGLWYKADNTNGYSSTTPEVGIVPSAISSGSSGTIRTGGIATGLSTLTVGARYYIGVAGALTSTAPSTNARIIGQADTATSLVLPYIPTSIAPPIVTARLTLTTAVPVTTSDVTAATTLYFTPYAGNQIALYDGSTWNLRTMTEISIAVPATTSQLYDVYVYDNSGTPSLELLAWTNDTTRATALTTQNGVLVKTGATTRRFVGLMRTTTVSGQTEDSAAKRYIWNYYNRVDRMLQKFEGASSWNYTTATIRQANAGATNQVEAVVGVAEDAIDLVVATMVINTTTAAAQIGIGVDSTTTFASANQGGYQRVATGSGTNNVQIQAWYRTVPTVGKHTYSWNEYSEAAGTTTWNAQTSAGSAPNSGIQGRVKG